MGWSHGGLLGAEPTATLHGEQAEPAGERDAADEREHPGVEARARERDALDRAAADAAARPGHAVRAGGRAADAVRVRAVARAVSARAGADVLVLLTGGVGVTAGVLLDDARLVAGALLVDAGVLGVAARDDVAAGAGLGAGLGALGERRGGDRGEHDERHERCEYLGHGFSF